MQGLVGPLPDFPHVIAICGLSGTGFKFAPVLGDIASQYATTGATTYDVGFLLPGRHEPTWPA
jgi:glycine/D-amino acid oxidase-like deaminating enzyme